MKLRRRLEGLHHGPIDQIDQATDFLDGYSLASNESVPGSWTLVPEPSTGALFAFSLSLLAMTRAPLSCNRLANEGHQDRVDEGAIDLRIDPSNHSRNRASFARSAEASG